MRKPEHVRSPTVWYHLGVIYERQKKFDIAEYCLKHCSTLLPPLGRNVELNCRLATCANRLGRPSDAIASYKAACSAAEVHGQSPEDLPWISEAFVWFEQGLMYDAMEESKLAQRCYNKAEKDPTLASDWQALGREYIGLREGERAVAAFQRAVELEPENPLMWWSMSEGYFILGDKEAALVRSCTL